MSRNEAILFKKQYKAGTLSITEHYAVISAQIYWEVNIFESNYFRASYYINTHLMH